MSNKQEVSGIQLPFMSKAEVNQIPWPIESQSFWHINLSQFIVSQDVGAATFISARQPYLVSQQIESE